jgi:precorrin-6B methylase 2
MGAGKPDARTVKAIERNMKQMKTPEKNLKKMAISKLYITSNFLKEITKLQKSSKSLMKIKHPDKEFNDLSSELDEYLGKLSAAIKKKDKKKAEEFWKDVKSICSDCHGAYKD